MQENIRFTFKIAIQDLNAIFLTMIILGITGLIASGKSFVADIFAAQNIAVFNADLIVHELYKDQDVVKAIYEIAPHSFKNSQLVRSELSNLAFKDVKILEKLERLIHPLVREKLMEFLQKQEHNKTAITLLDIPLLFAGGLNEICDYVIYCKSSYQVIEARYLARTNSTKEKLLAILARQNKFIKEDLANFIINTKQQKSALECEVKEIIKIVKNA